MPRLKIIATDEVITEQEYQSRNNGVSFAFPLASDVQSYFGVTYVPDPVLPDLRLYTYTIDFYGVVTVTPRDPQVIAAEDAAAAQIAKDIADAQEARQYNKLQVLAGMTPSEVQAWVDANVTTLATAKDAIKTLAVAISVLARRL